MDSVRKEARDTMVQVAVKLGPSFFDFILREMQAVLRRGYQLHVLAYTVHQILAALTDQLNTGACLCVHASVCVFVRVLAGFCEAAAHCLCFCVQLCFAG